MPILTAAAPAATAGLSGLTLRGEANEASVLLGDIQVRCAGGYHPGTTRTTTQSIAAVRLRRMPSLPYMHHRNNSGVLMGAGLPRLHPRHRRSPAAAGDAHRSHAAFQPDRLGRHEPDRCFATPNHGPPAAAQDPGLALSAKSSSRHVVPCPEQDHGDRNV